MAATPDRRAAMFKAALLLMLVICSTAIIQGTSIRDLLTAAKLNALLEWAGIWAPIVYIALYIAGVCLFIPASIMTALGAVVFGEYWGFLYVWIGAVIGGSLAFLIARYLGRDFAATLVGDRLKRYDTKIKENGFGTVVYLHLMYAPFTLMNFGMALTSVRFIDYVLGTAIGTAFGIFLVTFCIATLKEAFLGGQWALLLGWKMVVCLAALILSILFPLCIKMFGSVEAD